MKSNGHLTSQHVIYYWDAHSDKVVPGTILSCNVVIIVL